jgi:hypothetical protein
MWMDDVELDLMYAGVELNFFRPDIPLAFLNIDSGTKDFKF